MTVGHEDSERIVLGRRRPPAHLESHNLAVKQRYKGISAVTTHIASLLESNILVSKEGSHMFRLPQVSVVWLIVSGISVEFARMNDNIVLVDVGARPRVLFCVLGMFLNYR